MRIVQVPGPGGAAPPFRGGVRGESPNFNSDASQLILGATCKGAKAGRSREACGETDGPPIGPRVLTRQLGFGWTGPAELWTAVETRRDEQSGKPWWNDLKSRNNDSA